MSPVEYFGPFKVSIPTRLVDLSGGGVRTPEFLRVGDQPAQAAAAGLASLARQVRAVTVKQ